MRAPVSFLILALLAAGGCSLDSASSDATTVVVGYQSKTIDTVTAGALLKAEGFFEKRLQKLGAKYQVRWEDYDTGAAITAQMTAEKIDIGSMGDYPLLINGSRTQQNEHARTELVSVAGYDLKGALNSVVVPPDSAATSLADLRGQPVSASVGSAGHGTLVQALSRAGFDSKTDVDVLNQQPQVGASALESGQVKALAQFVAWPGLLVFQNKAKLLYDGAQLGVPTFHGVVVRRAFAGARPEVLDAFLQAQLDAADFLREKPLEAARVVADNTGLPPEVVYLYNGPGGASFEASLKPQLIDALKDDVRYLKSIGDFAPLDLGAFVVDGPLRKAYAERNRDYVGAPEAPGPAGEVWADDAAQGAADPQALLRAARSAKDQGKKLRAVYVRDSETGTRWFADKAWWLRDGANYSPHITLDSARRALGQRPGSVLVSFDQAVAEAGR